MKKMPMWYNRYRAGLVRSLDAFRDEVRAGRADMDAADTSAQRFIGTLDDLEFEAPYRLRAPSLMTATETLKQHERADWQSVDPAVQIFAASMIEAFRRVDIPLYVHGAFRTKEEQAEMVRRGVSKARWPYAPHCLGLAVDIVHCRYHWELTRDEWRLLGKIGHDVAKRLGLPMRWGGDWSFFDPAHWEMIPPSGKPVRKTPRGILAEFKGVKP